MFKFNVTKDNFIYTTARVKIFLFTLAKKVSASFPQALFVKKFLITFLRLLGSDINFLQKSAKISSFSASTLQGKHSVQNKTAYFPILFNMKGTKARFIMDH